MGKQNEPVPEIGYCKWFSTDKGYGFLVRNGKPDIFVHHTQIRTEGYRKLEEGQKVRFTVGISDRNGKEMAENVEILPADEQ